jgi:chromate transporter
MTVAFTGADWLALLAHFMSLSLLAIGTIMTTAPEMHSYLVNDRLWLTDNQFTSSISLGQVAPGPNVLFVAMIGWNIGINSSGGAAAGIHAWASGIAGAALAMTGILLPSSLLTLAATRWGHNNRERMTVRAFKQGMAPIVIGLLFSTAWILAINNGQPQEHWQLWCLIAATIWVVLQTRVHMLWMLAVGAGFGAGGFV